MKIHIKHVKFLYSCVKLDRKSGPKVLCFFTIQDGERHPYHLKRRIKDEQIANNPVTYLSLQLNGRTGSALLCPLSTMRIYYSWINDILFLVT